MAKEWDGTRSPFDAVQVRTDGFRDCIDAIKGAIALGQQGVSPAPEGHWLAEFWEIGRKLAASPADQVEDALACQTCNGQGEVNHSDEGGFTRDECPTCHGSCLRKDALPEQPPIDNRYVADGCEQFASPAALTDRQIIDLWAESGLSAFTPNWLVLFARKLLAASPADQVEDARAVPAGWKINPDEGGWGVVSPSGDGCYLFDNDSLHGQTMEGAAVREVLRQLCSSLVYPDAAPSATPPAAE